MALLPSGSIRKLVACSLVVCGPFASTAAARAETPSLRCEATRVGERVLVRVTLGGFVDRDLARLVRLGQRGTIQVDATLLRSRRFWFDDTIATRGKALTVTYVRNRGFVLDRRTRIPDPQRIEIGPLSLGFGRVTGSGLYIELTATVQVVTASSLRRTANWITGQASRSNSGVVRNRVIDLVVSDLARSDDTSCSVVVRRARRRSR